MISEKLARVDYQQVRRKAIWRQMGSRLFRRHDHLFAFEEVRQRLRAYQQHDLGFRQILVANVVGSVGRSKDFDRSFLPRGEQTKDRWVRIKCAYYDGVVLPPVKLYQVGELFFVQDGNLRVSVARQQGQEFIDAYVTAVYVPVPVTSLIDLESWMDCPEGVEFFEATRLAQLRPDAYLRLTLPEQYRKLREHISAHRWYRGIDCGRPISSAEAVLSWYDRVYCPVVETIRACNLLRHFPGRTESDLYLWLMEHRWFLGQQGVPAERLDMRELIDWYSREYGYRLGDRASRIARRMIRLLITVGTGQRMKSGGY